MTDSGGNSTSSSEGSEQDPEYCHCFATGHSMEGEGRVSPETTDAFHCGARKPGRPRAVPLELEPIVADLYRRGNGYRRIASLLDHERGVSLHYTSVKRALRRLGLVK